MNPRRLLSILILAVLVGSAALNSRPDPIRARPSADTETTLRSLWPEAASFEAVTVTDPVYAAFDQDHRRIGCVFFSSGLAQAGQGYGGPIHLAAAVTPEGVIKTVGITSHQETPGFDTKINTFLMRFSGRPIRSPHILGETVDGISGATVTSAAIVATLNAATERFLELVPIENPYQPAPGTGAARSGTIRLVIIALTGLVLWTLATVSVIRPSPQLRWSALILSFLVLAATNTMLSASHLAGLALNQLPPLTQAPLLYLLMTGAVITGILWGRVYCAALCPFGFLQELLAFLNRRFHLPTLNPGRTLDRCLTWGKYLVLLALLGACLVNHESRLAAAEVYVTLFSGYGTLPAWILLGVALTAGLFLSRFWCRYLCPTGALLGLVSAWRIGASRRNRSACADPAECLACLSCSPAELKPSSRPSGLLIFFVTMLSVGLLLASLITRLPRHGAAQKNLAEEKGPAYSTRDTLTKQFRDAGLSPRPARYWKQIHENESDH